jgi:hypothetical protein
MKKNFHAVTARRIRERSEVEFKFFHPPPPRKRAFEHVRGGDSQKGLKPKKQSRDIYQGNSVS